MSLGKVPERRCHQARYKQQAEHAGIHGKPESGNHPDNVTLLEAVEILIPTPHTLRVRSLEKSLNFRESS